MFPWHIDKFQSAHQMRRQASHVFSGERDGTAPRRKNPNGAFNGDVLPIPFLPAIARTSDFASVKLTSLITSDVP